MDKEPNKSDEFLYHKPSSMNPARKPFQESDYDEYLLAMKRVHRQSMKTDRSSDILSPRARYRSQDHQKSLGDVKEKRDSAHEATRIGVIASMVPDEIICKHYDYSVRSYETALMFIDVTGFTNLCERYTSSGHGGPSKLTQVLNSYIGAMILEILAHNGDVLKFSGDAFLTMWKKTARLSMQDVVHNAIDCGLIIQKNYGTFITDVGITLKVKVAISAGLSHFSIIGGEDKTQSSYVIIGQPVWDVKMAQYLTTAGDVLTSASAWIYVNEAEYCTQPSEDGRHTKVLGVGASWKRVERLEGNFGERVRPAVVTALRSVLNMDGLRRFMATPVLRAIDNDEPMDFLTEVRHVVVVFLNIITKTVTPNVLIDLVNVAYNCVSSVTSESGGFVNKVSMFDKDMMFLVVFGLRGLKHENEAQNAVLCAYHLMENLVDPNILSVSIGVTSGITYCGVVGHVLRREYTVIGPAVNKVRSAFQAARLMTTYNDIVSCDKETFLRSKLDQAYFKQLEAKELKGIANPGPVYQFSKMVYREVLHSGRHPVLGRDEELRQFKDILNNAIDQKDRDFTRYRDHKYAVVYMGCKSVGTSRMLQESLALVPVTVPRVNMILNAKDLAPYTVIRNIMTKRITRRYSRFTRNIMENLLQSSFCTTPTTPIQLHAMNVIFDCRFPLPERFQYNGDLLSEATVKELVKEICRKNCSALWVFGLDNAQYIDNESWRLLLIIFETKTLFVVMAISTVDKLTPVAKQCLSNHMIVKITLRGIDRYFHAALACQLLDVQAIPADLEKVIESASGGLPGWIQNFVISLVQRGALTITTMPRHEAQKLGSVVPSFGLLHKANDIDYESTQLTGRSYSRNYSYISESANENKQDVVVDVRDRDVIQVAMLPDTYTFDMNVDITMDAIILKTYDSLNPFEKMLLKCGSVLGDVFSRRMLLHLLQSNSPRKVAEAVAKLFLIRVLECEGGDFTRDSSLVLVHPAPMMPNPKPPFCACIGTRKSPSCRDLPMYAFCGYMKFRHSEFRTTTYELLTERQKQEMHARALLFLERYTRRCSHCGAGCFSKLLGLRSESGLTDENEALKRTRRQIAALSAEAKLEVEETDSLFSLPSDWTYHMSETEDAMMSGIMRRGEDQDTRIIKRYPESKRVRSFSSLDLENCECMSILQSVYSQLIDHCHGAGEYMKLFEAYLEYADLCINISVNIPQGVRLLAEVEVFIKSKKFCAEDKSFNNWERDFRLASVFSLRGICMLHMGDLIEARIQLFKAMKLYCVPFPTSPHRQILHNVAETMKQLLALYVVPSFYIARYGGVIGHFYEDIATTLNKLFILFTECKEEENAMLAAKWALNYALRTNSNLRVLCISYGDMISVYRKKKKFSICVKLEERATESCHRRRGQLDVTEAQAVCYLYTHVFLFYVVWGKKLESLEFGLSVMNMLSGVHNSETIQLLVLWMLKLLLCDIKIHDMVSIMTEFLYMTEIYELSSETWYYYYAVQILLDTGYCVESLSNCEKFYIKKGDALSYSKIPEAAWNFFVSMWLVTIRIGAWEKTILWEEKIAPLLEKKLDLDRTDFNAMMLIRMIEGLIIMLVTEMNNRNVKKMLILEKSIQTMLKEMRSACSHTPLYRPRYYFMLAYYNYIKGKKNGAFNWLKKSQECCLLYENNLIMVWVEHTRNHWNGTLNPKFVDYWTEHLEPENLLDYRVFDNVKGNIIPYTLPLPKDL